MVVITVNVLTPWHWEARVRSQTCPALGPGLYMIDVNRNSKTELSIDFVKQTANTKIAH